MFFASFGLFLNNLDIVIVQLLSCNKFSIPSRVSSFAITPGGYVEPAVTPNLLSENLSVTFISIWPNLTLSPSLYNSEKLESSTLLLITNSIFGYA